MEVSLFAAFSFTFYVPFYRFLSLGLFAINPDQTSILALGNLIISCDYFKENKFVRTKMRLKEGPKI